MPTRNAIKSYAAESYYHVYSRGINKQALFLDKDDYSYFLQLLKRYLGDTPERRPNRQLFQNYHEEIDLLSYCLMPNHIHLLFYQKDNDHSLPHLMHAIMTSYSMYFNKKYARRGPVFESRYLASLIENDSYLMHISRYIHLNPKQWRDWEYSSMQNYQKKRSDSWLRPNRILELFNFSTQKYIDFVEDYEGQKQILDELKHELAHE